MVKHLYTRKRKCHRLHSLYVVQSVCGVCTFFTLYFMDDCYYWRDSPWFNDWLIDCLIGWLIDLLINWLTNWLTDRLMDGWIDWLTGIWMDGRKDTCTWKEGMNELRDLNNICKKFLGRVPTFVVVHAFCASCKA